MNHSPQQEMLQEEQGAAQPEDAPDLGAQGDHCDQHHVACHGRPCCLVSVHRTFFMNSCNLGFVAFTCSLKFRDPKMGSVMFVARSYVSTTKFLNIWALGLGLLFIMMVIITVTVIFTCTLIIFQAILDITGG